MTTTPTSKVAIVGAGLSGLTLALSLHSQNIPCTIYESRPAPLDIGGAIMLSPNALHILDNLGVYEQIRSQGYTFEKLYFHTEDDEPVDEYEFGGVEKYGYPGLRIYRRILIAELSKVVAEAGIEVCYNKTFTRVLEENESSVTWEFEDGSIYTAPILVGADGIHSRVRRHLYPDLEPVFTKSMGVSASVPTSQLRLPERYHMPVTIMNKTHGAFVMALQQPDGCETFIGRQKRAPELGRSGWDALLNDKTWCVDYLRENIESFPAIAQNAVSEIDAKSINLWPFYVVPKLERWSSEFERVVILGDAAHAIPPSAGQGINQAFENVFTFAVVLGRCRYGDGDWSRGLKVWQRGRQERVDRVLELNAQIDKRRLPKISGSGVGGAEVEDEDEPFELEWLYSPDFTEMVEGWLAGERL
ncbi:FAD-dependent oxidoreductase [Aspergillus undulatus]|uniref:FAD-dependent oxidoreductase n=1 Tax=Aspergillus undulatus TaxID=1810928 RepID=UPI003CCCA5F8